MLTKIMDSNVGRGAQAVIPLRTQRADRLDVLTYHGNFLSMAAVQPEPARSPRRALLGRGYKQFELLKPTLAKSHIIAYHRSTGDERLIELQPDPTGDCQVGVSSSSTIVPNLTRGVTHLIAGIKKVSSGFDWMFLLTYNAANVPRTTRAYLWAQSEYRWIPAKTTTPLPAGITSMTWLSIGQKAYVAFLIAGRLEIHQIHISPDTTTPANGAFHFTFNPNRTLDAWTRRPGVQLASLTQGANRQHIVGYHPISGDLVVDRVSQEGPESLRRSPIQSLSWPKGLVVRTVDSRLLRYAADDGIAELWNFQ